MGRWYTPALLISTDSRCSNLPGPCLDTFFYHVRTRCSVSPGCAIHRGPRLHPVLHPVLHLVLHPSALTWGCLASLCSVPCLSATPEVDTGPVSISSPPFPPFYLALHIKLTSNTITNTFYSAHNDVGEAVRFSKPMSKRASTVGQVCMRVSKRTQSMCLIRATFISARQQHAQGDASTAFFRGDRQTYQVRIWLKLP